MHRRRWLATLGGLLSGCLDRSGEGAAGTSNEIFILTMTPVTDAEISRRHVVALSKGPTHKYQPQLTAAIANGSTNHTTTTPAIDPDTTLKQRYEGSVYQFSSSVVETHGTATYQYEVIIDSADEDVSGSKRVAYDALPAVDRSKLAANGFGAGTPEIGPGVGFQLTYTPAEQNQSVLVPTPEYSVIEWESDVRRQIRIEDSRQYEGKTYQYTADHVGTVQEVGKQLRTQYAFTLAGLSADQKAIIGEAIDNQTGYRITSRNEATVTEPVRDLFQRFADRVENALNYDDEQDQLTHRAYFLVEYTDDVHWTELRFRSDRFDTQK